MGGKVFQFWAQVNRQALPSHLHPLNRTLAPLAIPAVLLRQQRAAVIVLL